MAKYSIARYGKSKYGQTSANQVRYSVEPFTATANWYYSVEITWGLLTQQLTGPGAQQQATYWRLVRSSTGVPDNPDLGEYVDGGAIANPSDTTVALGSGTYLDNYETASLTGITPLSSFMGHSQITYSLWVYTKEVVGVPGKWLLVGQDSTHNVSVYGDTLNSVLRGLPGSWTTAPGSGFGYLTGEPEVNDLAYFLSGMTFYYDLLRAKAAGIEFYSNPSYTPVELLKTAVLDLGFEEEPTLGDHYHRSLYKVGNFINANKGTSSGVSAFATAVTHWGNEIYVGNNKMLDYNDSSFEEKVGNWAATTGTLTQKLFSNFETTSNIYSRVIPTPLSVLEFQRTDGFYARKLGFASLVLNGSGAGEIRCGNVTPIYTGIPVSAGNTYTFFVHAQHGTSVVSFANITLGVRYYSGLGVLVSTDEMASSVALTNSWAKYSHTTASLSLDSSIVYACPYIKISGGAAAGDVLFDMASFGVSNTQYKFEDARKVQVSMFGERENLLPNPSFEHGASGWTTKNSTGSLVQDIAPPLAGLRHGTCSGKVTASAANLTVSSVWVPVRPDGSLTFSAYVNSVSSAKTAKLRIEFSTRQYLTEQAAVSNGAFITTPYYVDSEVFNLETTSNTRLFVTANAPEESIYGIEPSAKVSIIFENSVATDVFYIDACLLEHSAYVREFFQGDGAKAPVDPNVESYISALDCTWEQGLITNYVQNPSFNVDTAGWTNVTRNSGAGKFGTGYGTVGSGTTASTVVVLPAGYEGSSVTFSVYVKGASSYTLGLSGGVPTSVTNTHAVNSTDWVRVAITTTATSGSITATIAGGAAFSIDGAQLEYENYATRMIGPESTGAVSALSGSVYTHKAWGSLNAGKSFYWINFETKVTRLNTTLVGVLPLGSSWELVYGDTTYRDTEANKNIFKSYSFDTSLSGWTSTVATKFYRELVSGTAGPSYSPEGTAYAVMSGTAAGTYSMKSPVFEVLLDNQYVVSIAVKSSTLSAITLKAAVRNTPSGSVVTTYTKSVTPTDTTKWYYVELVFPATSAFAQLEITAGAGASGDTVLVDRVIVRDN
jgi:hypothetical protein